MKFKDFPYTRPDYSKIKVEIEDLITTFSNQDSGEKQLEIIDKINEIRNDIETMRSLAYVRHTINTADEFYEEENKYWDEFGPQFELLDSMLYKAIINSPYLDYIKANTPETFIKYIEYNLKSFSEAIVEDLQLENMLISKYSKLIASAKIPFDGKIVTITQLTPYLYSDDRAVRQQALLTKSQFFNDNLAELDQIYDDLVNVRARIAEKLGYDNFVEVGYLRMNRYDYNQEMVQTFRQQVLDYIVPLNNKLYAKQAKRLGLDKLASYDDKYTFKSGNATPVGSYDDIVNNARKMYHELSPETADFIDLMLDKELTDLVSKPNKAAGGYCTSFPNYKVPFIFSNFNGSKDDIEVLTHEAGHAFQFFNSFHIKYPEVISATLESCEIHSMSMEFFTWPYMEYFFDDQADKFRFEHLEGALKFIPYGVLVDHYQHEVYNNASLTPEERRAIWRDLEKQYLPHKDYSDNPFLESGGWWYQQIHIYRYPFYYIDYCLAQICALQFWKRLQDKDPNAWNDYLHLCTLGGTKTFTHLVAEANLISPFDPKCVPSIIQDVEDWLMNIDDSKF